MAVTAYIRTGYANKCGGRAFMDILAFIHPVFLQLSEFFLKLPDFLSGSGEALSL
jgi:hypothetical protein